MKILEGLRCLSSVFLGYSAFSGMVSENQAGGSR